MKTLEQWQKELPDYELEQGCKAVRLQWSKCEVLYREVWLPLKLEGECWGLENDDQFILAYTLACLGATFRRKKERQREFKIEYDEEFSYKIDGDKHTELGAFFEKHNIMSATLTVNEWGGE